MSICGGIKAGGSQCGFDGAGGAVASRVRLGEVVGIGRFTK